MTSRPLLALGLVLVLAVGNGLIARNEAIVATGDTVYLQLAPVDPRSLMQGDYMALRYRAAGNAAGQLPRATTGRGLLILRLDARRVGHFARFHHSGRPLEPDELLIGYRWGDNGLEVGSNAWFFEEGQGHVYEDAEYGEFRVSRTGNAILVRLADEELKPLGHDRPRWWRGGPRTEPRLVR